MGPPVPAFFLASSAHRFKNLTNGRHKVSGLKLGMSLSPLRYGIATRVSAMLSHLNRLLTSLRQTWGPRLGGSRYPRVCRRGEGQYGIQAREARWILFKLFH